MLFRSERGGNTRYTGAWLRMKNENEVSDDFEEHFAANAGGYIDPSILKHAVAAEESQPPMLRAMSYVDPNVIETFAQEAPPTLAWLKRFGVRFIPLDIPFPTSVQPRIQPSGGGLALIEALATHFENNGGTIVYETTARELMQNERGEITGVKAVTRPNRPCEFSARAVILGCGSFEGNAAMMTHYLGQKATYLRAMSPGSHYNKGEGIAMALRAGLPDAIEQVDRGRLGRHARRAPALLAVDSGGHRDQQLPRVLEVASPQHCDALTRESVGFVGGDPVVGRHHVLRWR